MTSQKSTRPLLYGLIGFQAFGSVLSHRLAFTFRF